MGVSKGGYWADLAWFCAWETLAWPYLLSSAAAEPARKGVVVTKDAVSANLYRAVGTLTHSLAVSAWFNTPGQVITKFCTLLLAANSSLTFSRVVASFSTTRRLSHSTRPAVSYNRQRTVAMV